MKKTTLKTKADPSLDHLEMPEAGALEPVKKSDENIPGKKRVTLDDLDALYKQMPEDFQRIRQEMLEQYSRDNALNVYANSIESKIGYDALVRIIGSLFGRQVAYYRSEEGGALSAEEARKRVYGEQLGNEEAKQLLGRLLREPSDQINFENLHALHRNSPVMAENLWGKIKQQARNEFESGHRAAEVFEPLENVKDAWNRASYLGVRESFIDEWQPRGGIELSMIDAAAQAYLQYQYWMKECVKRSQTRPRTEDPGFHEWMRFSKAKNPKRWSDGDWDLQYVSEQEAINHAALMADRFQKMYMRALRSLRDFRRYNPQVTINNPQQVNIAADGGQQVNVKGSEETSQRKLSR